MFINNERIDENSSLRRVTLCYRLKKEERLAERLLLMREMLVIAPNYDGVQIEKYAGLRLDYGIYNYGDSYLFTISASQVVSKNLSYVFSSPYKQADKQMLSILKNAFYKDEKCLDAAKRKLVRENKERRRSGKDLGLSYSNVPLSTPVVSEKSILSLTLNDAYYPLSLINQCNDGTMFYFGPSKRRPEFDNPFLSFNNDRTYKLSSFRGDFLESEALFLSVHHKEAVTEDDERVAKAACLVLADYIQEVISKALRRRVSFEVCPLDNQHTLLSCSFVSNSLSLTRNMLTLEKGTSLSFLKDRDIENVILSDRKEHILDLSDDQREFALWFSNSLASINGEGERRDDRQFEEAVRDCLADSTVEDLSASLFTEESL